MQLVSNGATPSVPFLYDAEMAGNVNYETARARAKSLEQLNLKLNDKLEVRWLLERDDQTTPERKWWGARLVEQSSTDRLKITILYDAVEGFEETRSQVFLLDELHLYDIEEDAELPYRREGELVDTTDCERGEQDVVTFEELIEDNPEEDAQTQAEIDKLPHAVQVQVAERFEQFKSGFIDFLREKTEERGSDALINANDIADFVSKMKDKDKKSS